MAINEAVIVSAVSGLPFVGNEEGLIPAFGLYLTRHYSSFYNRVSFAALHHAERHNKGAVVRASLTDAGHQCAFFTFGGIMLSQEWQAVVQPMIQSREDWVRGIVAVVNALGWGVWKVDEIQANKQLTVSIERSYESAGYLADYPTRADGGVCFLAQGGVAGIMNLLYHGDITTRPALDEAYYKKLFAEPGRFIARETSCRATGAHKCTFVCERG